MESVIGEMKRIQLFEFEDLGWFPKWLQVWMINLIVILQKLIGVPELLADLFPSSEMLKKFKTDALDRISYQETSVDTTNIATVPEGLKTLVNCFHPMPPKKARMILESVQRTNQPLLSYEMGDDNIPLLFWWLLLPISLVLLIIRILFMRPFVKPLTCRLIIFTYLIPIIRICYAWDGQASLPRIYTLKDLDHLHAGLGSWNYTR